MVKGICYIGSEVLKRKSNPVEKITDDIKKICEELKQTMMAHKGIGLAAPQIGYNVRIFVLCVADDLDEKQNPSIVEPKIFINPKITSKSKEKVVMNEGCLSIPSFYESISRPKIISVEAMNEKGEIFKEENLMNWRGRCIQHEYDHLEGLLFVDRLSKKLRDKHDYEIKLMEMKFKSLNMGKELL